MLGLQYHLSIHNFNVTISLLCYAAIRVLSKGKSLKKYGNQIHLKHKLSLKTLVFKHKKSPCNNFKEIVTWAF